MNLDEALNQVHFNLELIDSITHGLTLERIQKFYHFQADISLVDEQCSICMEDFEVGRNMIRLDCDGRHVFFSSLH